MTPRSTRRAALSLILVALSATSCSLFRPDPAPAVALIAELKKSVDAHDSATGEALRELTQETFRAARGQLETERARRLAELRLEIWQRAEKERVDATERYVQQLRGAVWPLLQQLQAALEAEKGLGAEGLGVSANEQRAAAELSASLALVMDKERELRDYVDDQLLSARDTALDAAGTAFDALPALFDPAQESQAFWKQLDGTDDNAWRTGMHRALDQLDSFVQTDSALQLFLEGLVGEKLGEKIASALESRADELVTKGVESIEKLQRDQLDKLDRKLSRQKRGLEIPAATARPGDD